MPTLIESEGAAVFTRHENNMADWLRQNWYSPAGNLFDEGEVPWITAPQGPCWAYDRLEFNEIWLMWAARLFKTNFSLGTLQMQASLDPCDMMFATPDETNCKQVFTRWWKMLAACPPLRPMVPSDRMRAKTHIRLGASEIYGAWPRGKSRLADKSIRYGVANEIDKWEVASTTTEGDPVARFAKRGAEYVDRKFLFEGTPGTARVSRIERGFTKGTQHRFHVPCPHCMHYQTLKFGDAKTPGGIKWDKSDGHTTIELARRTARYICEGCDQPIDDTQRRWMAWHGVWVPAGCTANANAINARDLPAADVSWLDGEPDSTGGAYSSHLNVFNALFHGWGQMAEEFLVKKGNLSTLRQWTNEDAAKTWHIILRKTTWQELHERVASDVPREHVPPEYKIVTLGIDKQAEHYKYVVKAWRNDKTHTGHTMAYGAVDTEAELLDLMQKNWPAWNASATVEAAWTLIDSGFKPADVHTFVREARHDHGLNIRACRGSRGARLQCFYRSQANSKRTSHPGVLVTTVDTHSTQDWIEKRLHVAEPEEPGAMTVYSGSQYHHKDYLEELLNDGLVQGVDTSNNVTESWKRVDDTIPNDYRDCERYAFCAYLIALRTGGRQHKPAPRAEFKKPTMRRRNFKRR